MTCDGPALFFEEDILIRAGRWVLRLPLDGDAEPVTDVVSPPVQSLALEPERGVLFAGRWNGVVHAVHLRDGRRMEQLTLIRSRKPVVTLALSHGRRRLLPCSADFHAYLLDAYDGREVAVLGGHRHGLFDVSFDAEDRVAATVAMDGRVRVFDLPAGDAPAGQRAPRLTMNHARANGAHFLGPDRIVATGVRRTAFWSLTRDDLRVRESSFGIAERLTAEEDAHLERLLHGMESR